MAEIMEEKKELTPAETAAPASPETPAKRAEKSTADKKKRRRTIRRIVALVVVAALIAGGVKFFKKKDGSSEVGIKHPVRYEKVYSYLYSACSHPSCSTK